MKNQSCPHCANETKPPNEFPKTRRLGSYYRKSDKKRVVRLKCMICKRSFLRNPKDPCRFQKNRQLNDSVQLLLSSGVSLRRMAILLGISRSSVSRKLMFLGTQAQLKFCQERNSLNDIAEVQFDDLETSEHTKCKPLSVTLAVENKTRRILGFEVSQMSAKGKLSRIALKKYGPRKDERSIGRKKLFGDLTKVVLPAAEFSSDENPHYPKDLKHFFPNCIHKTSLGRRGCVVGQGELKRGGFDPLFVLNHTCAMLRANINRLFRRTWCTTKKRERLIDHLFIYANFHNNVLIKAHTS